MAYADIHMLNKLLVLWYILTGEEVNLNIDKSKYRYQKKLKRLKFEVRVRLLCLELN